MSQKLLPEAKTPYTPTEVLKITEYRLVELTKNLQGTRIAVKGVLGEIKDSRYSIVYDVPLRDPVTGYCLSLNIPVSIADQSKAFQEKEVTVYGILTLKFMKKGNVSLSMDVTQIKPEQEQSPEMIKKEETLSSLLRAFSQRLVLFPNLNSYTISVIHPQNSQTLIDFKNQLNSIENIHINTIEVNMLSVDEIVNAIKTAPGDVVVLLRGGGPHGEIDIFNDLTLVKAWIEKDAYKISAIGHSNHKTYVDAFSCFSADTPTAAGIYIKENILLFKTINDCKTLSVTHKKEMEKLSMEITNVWAKKLDEIQKQKDKDMREITRPLQEQINTLSTTIQSLKRQKYFAICIIIALFMFIVLRFLL